MPITIDHQAATARLIRFLATPGVTGEEALIAKEIRQALTEVGVSARSIKLDDANKRIPLPTQTGNLIVNIPGRGSLKSAKPLLFMTHMDTVPLCAGAKPKQQGRKIVNEAAGSALGGDNRTGCAVLVTLAAELAAQKLPHPPLTLLFTVREESGLFGARHIDPELLGGTEMGFNFDGRDAAEVCIGAVGADRWEVEIYGKASHAGVHPERGISATLIFAIALQKVHQRGWFGKVVQGDKVGTSNIGLVGDAEGRSAGNATNVVTDYLLARGESRSHNAKFVREITNAYKQAFQEASNEVKDSLGKTGKIKFVARQDYFPFRISEQSKVAERACEAVKTLGRKPSLKATDGGLDANWVNKHGIPTVTFGAGQNDIHTVKEWIDLNEFDAACQLAVILATQE